MIYVMSDIHGEYEKYLSMLEKIKFSDEDTLYILGDMVDRGKDSIKVVQDIMCRKNVYALFGNHDYVAYIYLSEYYRTGKDFEDIEQWLLDGGQVTYEQFLALDREEQKIILDFLGTMPLIDMIDIGENLFILCHAGLGNFSLMKDLEDYSISDLIEARVDNTKRYFPDNSVYIVHGHTPTRNIWGKDEIFKYNGNIVVDCGAVHGGKLGCMCLNTFEEYYI